MSTVQEQKPVEQKPAEQKGKAKRPTFNAAYLEELGWVPMGNPNDKETQWLDPTRDLLEEKYEKVTRQMEPEGQVERMNEIRKREGLKLLEKHYVEQVRVTPQAEPVSFTQAIRIAYTRYLDELRKQMPVKQKA
jgi:hypothetical protein